MHRELWAELSAAVSIVDHHFCDNSAFTHSTACIVRVYLWSVLHQASVLWACQRVHWDRRLCPTVLPDQSTLSRRMRTPEFEEFMSRLEARLRPLPNGSDLFKRLDAKPLPIPAHSTDRDSGWGRGAGQQAKGYKLHTIWAGQAIPMAWRVAPLNISEQEMARRMMRGLHAPGYIVADKNYDANRLFDSAAAAQNQLLCPRRLGRDRGLGHHRHSPFRLRSKTLLELPPALGGFGRAMMAHRREIERDFAHCTSFTGGLIGLPPWVRRYSRVRRWVWAKLLINAARIRIRHRRKCRIGA